MKIAIIGSGISGLSFWLFLRKLDLLKHHEVTIYEARQQRTSVSDSKAEPYNASVIGASIGLSTNGLNVLKRCDEGLHEEVTTTGHIIRTFKTTNARGWTLGDAPVGPDGQTMVMIGRQAFWQILKERVPDNVVVTKKLLRIEKRDTGNALVFADGSRAAADLVVGADGIWSVVRRAIFAAPEGNGEYEYSPRYEGLIGVGGFVPASSLVDVPDGEMNVVFGANGSFGYGYTDAPRPSADQSDLRAVWWSTYSLDKCPEDWRHIDRQDVGDQLRARHSSWRDKTIRNIVREVEVELVYPMFTTPLLPTWERDGLVLIGDAAHALQPSSGQGASMALEDSEALALFLRAHLARDLQKGHLGAAKQYCELRKSRVAMVHKKAQGSGLLKQDMSLFQEMLMYFFMWLINRLHLRQSYNKTLYDYNGPAAVEQKFADWEQWG